MAFTTRAACASAFDVHASEHGGRMADFDEFEDEVGSEWLAQVDAIEARCLRAPPPPKPVVAASSADEAWDPTLEALLLQGFDQLDEEIKQSQSTRAPLQDTTNTPISRPGAPAKSSAPRPLTQQGLFGRPPISAPSSNASSASDSHIHTAQGLVSLAAGLGRRRGKVWDHHLFMQQRNCVARGVKGGDDDVDDDDEALSISECPPRTTPPRMSVALDEEQAQTWIYPINKPLRSYQLNIVKKALFHNVLVALPTGLGKTFIAAVVILNYVRWFPKGKIIFVAPTRPLVNQQQQACHSLCGLPWDLAIELTGSTKRALRDDEWKSKRIFYMTPQTFENDLLSTTCDPTEVVCVVVDEAHRATGNYAYGKVIRHLMYYNPYFRVLALTATPGNHAERVQEVVDHLHIDRIEIRTEDAIDIQPYLHKKKEDLVRVALSPALDTLRRRWAELMRVYYDPLHQQGVLRACDPAQLRAFAVRAASADAHGRAILQSRPFLRGFVQQLATMAQIMQYLVEQSVRVFCERVHAMATPGKGTTKREQVFSTQNSTFRDLLENIEAVQADPDLLVHPKMRTLRDVLMRHFASASHAATRAMVFCTFREVVNEIVALLCEAGLRATPFVGQASDTKGNRGFTQRMQEQVLRDFQKGTYQVLVATSIGEEGLDIGEVDLIVCYDAVRDSVRGLQRIGRTGRLRDGRVVVLMAEGREESNWQHSKASYKSVQRLVRDANMIELYTDVPRLVPAHIQPQPIMREVEQPEPATAPPPTKRTRREPRPPRSKRRPPPPPDASLTFCWAAELRRRDEHREGAASPSPPPSPDERPRSSSSSLLRSSSLNGTVNLSDDSDDQALCAPRLASGDGASIVRGRTLGVRPALRSPRAPTASPARFAPHPLVAALDGGLDELPSPQASSSPSLPEPPPQRCREHPRRERRATGLFFQDEAERETDSDIHGETDEDDDGPSTSEENDDDRAAVGDFVPTQQAGYEQQAVYMQSMLSQEAPTPFRRRDRLWELLQRRDALRPSSEASGASVDEYSQDSFVVGDDEISWASSQASSVL